VLGKSDLYVARETPAKLDGAMPPGHSKFDFAHSIDELEADVVDMPGGAIWPDLSKTEWFLRDFRADRFEIGGYHETLWFRKESPRQR
jgi:hypothetical protein